jgi:translation initiation factor 3 subunit D
MIERMDLLFFRYVSRVNPRDNSRHVILATQFYKPRELAQQVHFDLAHGWGIVRAIIDIAMELPEGRYSLLKDPMKPILRLYAMSKGSDFSNEAEL